MVKHSSFFFLSLRYIILITAKCVLISSVQPHPMSANLGFGLNSILPPSPSTSMMVPGSMSLPYNLPLTPPQYSMSPPPPYGFILPQPPQQVLSLQAPQQTLPLQGSPMLPLQAAQNQIPSQLPQHQMVNVSPATPMSMSTPYKTLGALPSQLPQSQQYFTHNSLVPANTQYSASPAMSCEYVSIVS